MASLPIGRITFLAVAIEVVSILSLVAVVAAVGPNEKVAATQFAEQTGVWFGPLSGAILCFLVARWLTGAMTAGQVLCGAALGLAVAIVDVALLVAGGTDFRLLFVASNILRVIAGSAGGLWSSQRRPSAA